MGDQGDWWARPSSPSARPGLATREPAPWIAPPFDPAPRRRSRIAPGLVAGATALTLALAGGGLAIDRQNHPFASGVLPGSPAGAKGTSAPSGGRLVPKLTPKATKPAEPVLTVAQVASRVEPGVVIIQSELGYQNAEAAGTGMVLTPDGEVLTNNHVINGATKITVTVAATQRRYVAGVVGTVPASDVAVLQLEGASGLATIPVGDSAGVTPGQAVVAIGNAGGRGTLAVVAGTVTSTNRTITASDASGSSSERLTGMIEVEAPIKAGDSGGPLSSRAGKVIGMDTAASASRNRGAGDPTFGFAIPINRALSIATKIRSGDRSGGTVIGGRGYLGVQVRTADAAAQASGAEIVLITPGSPAAAAGLESGDIVTTLNGSPVTSADSLTTSLRQSGSGQVVTVGWTDHFGQPHSAKVRLATGPAD